MKESIRRELITPHKPKKNGLDERKNRSIFGVTKAMLHDQGFPMFFWVEACNTRIFLQNKSPHKVLI